MSIADADIKNCEIVMAGSMAAAGSNAVNVQNVYHYRRTTTINPFNRVNLEAKFQSEIALNVLAALNIRLTQVYNTVRILNDPLDQAVATARAVAGSITGDSMASLDMCFVKLSTGIKGKSYRGNKKYGPLSESDSTTTSDVLNAGALTKFGTILTKLLAGFTDAGGNTWVLQVYSRTLDVFAVKPLVAANDVVSGAVNHRVSRIRRRQSKSVY